MHKRLFILMLVGLCSCATPYKAPDLGRLYNGLAQNESPQRNAVILIFGLLGSKLAVEPTGQVAWGAFGLGGSPSDSPAGLRQIALPMKIGTPLPYLRDNLVPAGALSRDYQSLGLSTGAQHLCPYPRRTGCRRLSGSTAG